MSKRLLVFIISYIFISCSKDEEQIVLPKPVENPFISAVDISRYPEISDTSPVFYDTDNRQSDFLDILQNHGVNTIRLRLWVDPENQHSGFSEVKAFSETLKTKGFKIWLALHYSDTWADPGHQLTPKQWQNLSYSDLQDNLYLYTENVVTEIQPDYIQIGNEINPGFLHPEGNITDNQQQFTELIKTAISAVRNTSDESKVILHYAGIDGANWFFNVVKNLDYDIIGISFYPIWHGKSFSELKGAMNQLSNTYEKDILIAETAYPFTLDWADWTNNIVGLESQLILPDYPASKEGQKNFIRDIKNIMLNDVEKGIGFCYWGAELIAWKGDQATKASPWENQALFDFNNKALPVLEEFIITN